MDEESRGQLAAAAAAREAAQRDADELRERLAAVQAASPLTGTAQQAAAETSAQRAAAEAAQQEAETTCRQLAAVVEERASRGGPHELAVLWTAGAGGAPHSR